jgi:hypothetical protein
VRILSPAIAVVTATVVLVSVIVHFGYAIGAHVTGRNVPIKHIADEAVAQVVVTTPTVRLTDIVASSSALGRVALSIVHLHPAAARGPAQPAVSRPSARLHLRMPRFNDVTATTAAVAADAPATAAAPIGASTIATRRGGCPRARAILCSSSGGRGGRASSGRG